ncbi:Hypp4880 [Branchiostoma lanceolatum]|uniref:Hypp4880 protein n=1 Tax=Branchiostoma lanceolatum TaxID=7740 RepID=A0A8K0AAW4_BRALA|nr:Hypp4880 [Branchiostoma lanceolatum]
MEAPGSLKKTDIVARYHEYKRLWSLHPFPGEYKDPCWKPPESWKWVAAMKSPRSSTDSLNRTLNKDESYTDLDTGNSNEKEEPVLPEEPN